MYVSPPSLALRRLLFSAAILAAASGCDKPIGRRARRAAASRAHPKGALDLSTNPTILFQIFGASDDIRMMPVAAVQDSGLHRIVLSAADWHRFDSRYFRPGASYPIYQDGRPVGTATVKRGMWPADTPPLYELPGCGLATPLAEVTVDERLRRYGSVRLLAANANLERPHTARPLGARELQVTAKAVAYGAGQAADIGRAMLDSLDFRALGVPTGVGPLPTLIATFIDPAMAKGASTTAQHTTHLFVVADLDSAGDYRPSFVHRVNGSLESAEFRSYVDHLALTGGATDEILLDGWHYGGESFLIALGYDGSRWKEVFRSRPAWCLDDMVGAQ